MPAFRDKTGMKIGRLSVIGEAPKHPSSGRVRWLCRCDCGAEVIVTGSNMREGATSSCGCLQRERTGASAATRVKHGHAKSGGGNKRLTTPEYRSWKAMLERVRNSNAPNYHLYGGRGISICDRWLGPDGFANFLADMGERPKGKTLDREEVNGNYEPGNCHWATAKEQRANQRNSAELDAIRRSALDRGRRRTWDDPELRAKLLARRRKG